MGAPSWITGGQIIGATADLWYAPVLSQSNSGEIAPSRSCGAQSICLGTGLGVPRTDVIDRVIEDFVVCASELWQIPDPGMIPLLERGITSVV